MIKNCMSIKTGFSELMRLSHAVRRLQHNEVIRKGGFVLLVIGLAGLTPRAIAQSFPAEFELSDLFPLNGGDGTQGFVLKGIGAAEDSGISVSNAGDINGDGIDDLIIGAPNTDPNGARNAGQTYVVFGRTTGFPAAFQLRSLLPAAGGNGTEGFVLKGIDGGDVGRFGDNSGISVSNAGDVNGDGIDDLIIGAVFAGRNGRAEGQSYVLFGRTTGFPAAFELSSLLPGAGGDGTEGFVLNGVRTEEHSGAVSNAGDVNGDGIDDFIIGAPSARPSGVSRAGQSYVVFGRTTGFPAAFELSSLLPAEGGDGTVGFVLQGIDEEDRSGGSVSNAGDVNGDGIDDFIIGAQQANPMA